MFNKNRQEAKLYNKALCLLYVNRVVLCEQCCSMSIVLFYVNSVVLCDLLCEQWRPLDT